MSRDPAVPADKRLFALADNRIAQLAGWNEELLAIELQELETMADHLDSALIVAADQVAAEIARLLGGDTAATRRSQSTLKQTSATNAP